MIIILFFGVKYLFITRIDIDDIKIEINNKYDFNSLKGKIRNKDIDLSNDSNIDYSKLGEYEVTLESHEKYAINTKKKVKVYVVDDEKPTITLKDNDIVINYKEEYTEPGYTANDNYDGDITDKVIKNIFFLDILSKSCLALSFNLLIVRIAIKIEKAIIKKSTIVVIKDPYLIEELPTVKTKSEKSTFPVKIEIAGIIISLTKEVTIF